ncbi:MAG: hypothetical protein ABI340_02760 [Nitrososphaera sp.]|jgi:hypothetical protein
MSLQKGRPSKKTQIQIINDIRSYFEKSFSATFTSSKTGYDIKTVCKYFNEWSEQIVKNEDEDFIKRQREAKELSVLNYDRIIFEEYILLDDINKEIKKIQKDGKPVPKHLISTKFLILREISNMTQSKFGLIVTPTMDWNLNEVLEKLLNKHGLYLK